MVISHDESPGRSRGARPSGVVFNPDFFVEKLRHESPDVFLELVLSNITRLIDLPGTEFSQLLGDDGPKTPTSGNGGFFRSFNFLKRKDKGVVFGTSLSESSIGQIYQMIEYLSKHLHVEGLFRVPGNSVRQQTLKELLHCGTDVDLNCGDYHPNDVATLLKTLLGELPEPLLTHRHFHAYLKIAEMTLFDERGDKTAIPNKERQLEALQLLLLLLPQANRSLLKLLLDLLYHTAKQQDRNKMSASNLALMFAPHVLWPKHMTAIDLKDNLKKLNTCMAFLIKNSQKLFRAPAYLRDLARVHFTGTKTQQTKDDLDLLSLGGTPGSRALLSLKRATPPGHSPAYLSPAQPYTEEALKELFRHVNNNMPDSAKKKKLVRQLVKHTTTSKDNLQVPAAANKKHPRSRSFGGLIKRRNRCDQLTAEKRFGHATPEAGGRQRREEDTALLPGTGPAGTLLLGSSGLVLKNQDFNFNKLKPMKVSKDSPSVTRMCFSPTQEVSV